jgi:hypothetical protein
MKKAGLLAAVVILVFGLVSCGIDTSKWQSIQYDKTLIFKVPSDWVVTRTFEGLVFSDRSLEEEVYVLYMIEIDPYLDNEYIRFDNPLIGKGYLFKDVYSEMDSSGNFYHEQYVEINEISKVCRLLVFTLYTSEDYDFANFLILDDTLNKEIIMKIKSTVTFNID